MSPAESLAKDTIDYLMLYFIPPNVSIVLLAILEVTIGIFLLLNIFRNKIILLALAHMRCTFAPLFLNLTKLHSPTALLHSHCLDSTS